jgi:hypothetical protein
MRRPALLAYLGLLAPVLTAQAADQTRTLPAFTSIVNSGPVNVVVNVGQPQSVVVSAPDDYQASMRTEVIGGVLRITMKDHTFHNPPDMKVTVNVPSLTKYALSGAGGATLSHVTGDSFAIECSGAGTVKADGNVRSLELDVSGVGSIDAQRLVAQSAEANVSGVGSLKVYASDSLVAILSGVGSLTYFGHPRNVTRHSSGIGSVSAGD